MRSPFLLTILTAGLATSAALADIKRHDSIPQLFHGSWAPSQDACRSKDNSDNPVTVVSATSYAGPNAKCTVAWVSETPGANGAIYSAHLLCGDRDGMPKTQSNVIMLRDKGAVLMGSSFNNLKPYQRCTTD